MRVPRNTKTSPQCGFARSASLTSADGVCTDLRKLTGCAASTTLRSDLSAITGCPEAPSKASPVPHPARPDGAPLSSISITPQALVGDALISLVDEIRSSAAPLLSAPFWIGTELGTFATAAAATPQDQAAE